jgi:hypothetical protein
LRLSFIFIIAFSLHILHAQDTSGIKDLSLSDKIRPVLMKIIGEEWTLKLIGVATVDNTQVITLPVLPKVVADATSINIYSKKKDKIVLDAKLEEKFYYTYYKEIYEATRQLKPNDDEIAKAMNTLSQEGTREGVYHSLVLDSTYAGMENYDKPIKKNTADFAVYFYARYIGLSITKESLKDMNVYSLKRILGDKTLDIIDAFGENREDLEKWYAVMSSDLASKFPLVWSSNIRKNTSSEVHKSWASRVPVQHIKSESLIKIHGALNSMM